jgi:hypothetical protein
MSRVVIVILIYHRYKPIDPNTFKDSFRSVASRPLTRVMLSVTLRARGTSASGGTTEREREREREREGRAAMSLHSKPILVNFTYAYGTYCRTRTEP